MNNATILCDLHGGPAHGRQAYVDPDPGDPHLPAPTLTVHINNSAGAGMISVQYLRREISNVTHRWTYRPAVDY